MEHHTTAPLLVYAGRAGLDDPIGEGWARPRPKRWDRARQAMRPGGFALHPALTPDPVPHAFRGNRHAAVVHPVDAAARKGRAA